MATRRARRWGSGWRKRLHHGTDHRSQICTALTSLGVDPPSIDVWDFAALDGRLVEFPPPS